MLMAAFHHIYCDRRCLTQLCWFCWLLALLIGTVLWVIFTFLLMGGAKALPLDNPVLAQAVQNLSAQNCTFSNVCRFKDWTYFVGTEAGKVLNHYGAVLEVVNASGATTQYLQLEYGARGTYWQLNAFPRPDGRYGIVALDKVGKMPCRYKCGHVREDMRDPKQLLWWLNKYQFKLYNVFWWNCIVFARSVYYYHRPQNETCYKTSEIDERMWNLLPLTGGKPADLFVMT